MKKIFLNSTALALAVFALTGCPGTATNTTNTTNSANTRTNSVVSNANTLNSNTGIVVNSNSNMLNANISNSTSPVTTLEGFMTEAAKGGMEEIELSKLALNIATNKEIKDFAQKMVTDHTKASGELKALAAKKKFTLPAELTPEQVSMTADMAKLPREDFNKNYVDAMVKDHEKDVSLFEAQSKNGTDADAKAFAAKTLPTLQMHLTMVRELQAKVK